VTFVVTAGAGGVLRMTARLTLVWVEKGQPAAWPAEIRRGFNRFLEGASDAQPA
jgi:acyl-CoA thioesterase FadM